MPEFKRVRLDGTGAEVTVAVVRDGMTVIDKPALDKHGRPLGDTPASKVKAPNASRYDDLKAAELRGEIDRRNFGRDEDEHIVPTGRKNADLIAALEADDQRAATPTTPSGDDAADTSEEDPK